MNDEAARQGRPDSDHLALSVSAGAAMRRLLLAEIERAEAFGVDPGASRLWLRAPWHLRREYADGRITREDFWLALRRWILVTVSEERAA